MVESDNNTVFMNTEEYADLHTVRYDGNLYKEVPCVISQMKAQDRNVPTADHAQGIYLVTAVCHFPLSKLDNIIPEKGKRIDISDETGFMKRYYVAQSGCDLGMVRLELEAYDE